MRSFTITERNRDQLGMLIRYDKLIDLLDIAFFIGVMLVSNLLTCLLRVYYRNPC
jgi:hypothetical protein